MAMSSTFNVRCEGLLVRVQSELSVGALTETIKHRFQLPADQGIALVMTNDGQEMDIFDDQDLRNVAGGQLTVYRNLPNPMALRVGSEVYSLDKAPSSSSRLVVLVKREDILPDFDVPGFVVGLLNLGKQIRVTNIQLLAGNKLEFQTILEQLVEDHIQPLTENCTATLETLEKKCRKVLELLVGIFQYWKDGLLPQSLTNLKRLMETAGEMKDECGERLKEINSTMGKLKEFMTKIKKARVTTSKIGERLEDELEDKKKKLGEEERAAACWAEEVQIAEERANTARAEFESLKPASDAPSFKRLLWGFKKAFSPTVRQKRRSVDETRTTARESASAKTEADEAKRIKEELVSGTKIEYDDVSQAEEYILKAIQAIEKSRYTMRGIIQFWSRLEVAIKELCDNVLLDQIKQSANDPNSDVMKVLQSIPFKKGGIIYMARLVAIQDVSKKCRKAMAEAKEDMNLFPKETSFSKEEAKAMLNDPAFMQKLRAETTASQIGFESTQPVQESGDEYDEARMAFQLTKEVSEDA